MNLKGVVAGLLPYGPSIAEHVTVTAGLEASRQPGKLPLSDEEVARLFAAVQKLEGWFAGLEGAAPRGYIGVARAGGPSKRQRQKQAAAAAAAAGEGAAAGGTAAAGAGVGGEGEGGEAAAAAAPVVYEDFNPLRLAQAAGEEVVEFESFDDALDEFFSKVGVWPGFDYGLTSV